MAKYDEQFDFVCKIDGFKGENRAFVYGEDCLVVYKDPYGSDILFANLKTSEVNTYINDGFYKKIS